MTREHEIHWIDRGYEPRCAPNPSFPDGIDIRSPTLRKSEGANAGHKVGRHDQSQRSTEMSERFKIQWLNSGHEPQCFAQPGLARRAARRVQRHEAMDAHVRLSSRGQLSDHPGRRCGHESKRVDDRAVAATRDRGDSMLNERKDDDQETQTSFVTV
jgi:hypothetical protein